MPLNWPNTLTWLRICAIPLVTLLFYMPYPVADKLIVAVALVLLVSRDPRALITLTAAVIIGREITISALREWMAEIGQRRKVAVSQLGKYKTILQIVGLSFMLFRVPLFGLPTYNPGVVLTEVAAAATLVSMLAYL